MTPSTTPELRATVGAVELANPIMTASGTSGHGAELSAFMDLSDLGAVVVKSVSTRPWAGNPAPRIYPVRVGMLNSVGLQNPGVDEWLAHELPALAATGATVVASIWGQSSHDYRDVAERVADAYRHRRGAAGAIVAVEANISCPNIEDRSRMFAHSREGIHASVSAAAEGLAGALPLWVKMSPNVTDLPGLAAAAVESGAAALTLVNTLMGLAIDPSTGRPRLGAGGGGLSGPAIHPVAVRAVFECHAALPATPLIGVGGVTSGADAAELIAAGASAVQVGTATFAEPTAPSRIRDELRAWCERYGINKVEELKGRAHKPK